MKIEKNIPPPRDLRPKAKASKWPFQDMEVGDSFLVEGLEANKVFAAKQSYMTTHPGTRFICRSISDTEVRCWRIQ